MDTECSSHPKSILLRLPKIPSKLGASSATGWAQRWAPKSDLSSRWVDLRLWLPGSLPRFQGGPCSSVSLWPAKLKETQKENLEARRELNPSQKAQVRVTGV